MTLLIMLCVVDRLVWAGDMICGPERLIDSDEEPRELLWLGSRVVLVIRAITGAPLKARRGRVSLCSSVERDRPACVECVDIKLVISVDCEILYEMS